MLRRILIAVIAAAVISAAITALIIWYPQPTSQQSISLNLQTSEPTPDEPTAKPGVWLDVVNEVTGSNASRWAEVTVAHLDGTVAAHRRSLSPGQPIHMAHWPPGIPCMAKVYVPGYETGFVGPVTWDGESHRGLIAKLTPLVPVSIVPDAGDGPPPRFMRVSGLTVPEWFEEVPVWWKAGDAGEFQFALPPGRYVGQLRNHHEPIPVRETVTEGLWADAPGLDFQFEFEVKATSKVLKPELKWVEGSNAIRGVVEDSKGRRLAGAQVIARSCGPGLMRQVAASTLTDAEGRFELSKLASGGYWIGSPSSDHGHHAVEWVQLDESDVNGIRLTFEDAVQRATRQWSGRVRILKNGQPLRGATLVEEGHGSLHDYTRYSPGFGRQLGLPADESGLVTFSSWSPNMVVTAHPHTVQKLQVQLSDGEPQSFEFELAPAGTATVVARIAMGDLGFTGGRFLGIPNKWDRQVFLDGGYDSEFEVMGIPPGEYLLEITDHAFVDHVIQLQLGADERREVEYRPPSRRVSGKWTLPLHWRHGDSRLASADLYYQYQSAEGIERVAIDDDVLQNGSSEWAAGFSAYPLPPFVMSLLAVVGERPVAVAMVDARNEDVDGVEWRTLTTGEPDSGAKLRVEVMAAGEDLAEALGRASLTLSLSMPGTHPIEIATQSLRSGGNGLFTLFDRIAPGEWTVLVSGQNFVPFQASMQFVAGSTASVSIQPSPEWVGWIRSQPALQKKIELPTTRRHPPAPNTKRDLSHRFECWIYLDGISPEMAIHALVDWNGHAVLPGQKSLGPYLAKLDLFTVEGRAALRLEMSSIESGRITICIPGLPRKSLDLGEDIAAVSVDFDSE